METKAKWLLIALVGSTLAACGGGDDPGGINAKAASVPCPAWSGTASYPVKGLCVTYQNQTYVSNYWATGITPSNEPWGAWSLQPVTPPPAPPAGPPPPPLPPPPPPAAPPPPPSSPPTSGREIGAYFAQWGIYSPGRDYQVADIHTTQTLVNGTSISVADQLTFINYAFGNIYKKNGGYECDMVTKAEPGNADPSSPDAGTGGDAAADYMRPITRTVNNLPEKADAKIWGNFAQLKLLKEKHPKLKVFISLGGWSWSKYFSDAAKTDALRKQLVRSCIKQYIAGDLPLLSDWGTQRGGAGAAQGIFDGIDVDWEFPGLLGQPYNSVDAVQDKHNFTLLMAEFRAQLDAQGLVDGKHYPLTAAIGGGVDKIAQLEPKLLSQTLDWINLMSYDYHGGWESERSNFNAPLFHDPADPSQGTLAKYNANDSITALTDAGMPSNKIILGVPFYGRGWKGVSPGPNGNGLYQAVGGAAKGKFEDGIDDYKVLKTKNGTRSIHPVTKQMMLLTADGDWWSYDDPTAIASKMQYVRDKNLGGAFAWELDGDASGELGSAMWQGR